MLVLFLSGCAYSGSTQDAKKDAHQMVKGLLNTVNRRLSHDG
ncbi:GntR family transcriptional regulator, partial [Klebsiella pneumoniae]